MILKNNKIFPDSERNENFKKLLKWNISSGPTELHRHGRNVNIKKGYITS